MKWHQDEVSMQFKYDFPIGDKYDELSTSRYLVEIQG